MSATIYSTFAEIPTEHELRRMSGLAAASRRKWLDTPELLSETDFQVLEVMGSEEEARKARRACAAARLEADKRATKAAPITAPPRPAFAMPRADESLDKWAERTGDQLMPVWAAWCLFEPLIDRVKELDARVARAEEGGSKAAAPSIRWCGHWRHGEPYAVGSAVTDKGGLWLAIGVPTNRPGTESSGWRLIVKRGAHQDQD